MSSGNNKVRILFTSIIATAAFAGAASVMAQAAPIGSLEYRPFEIPVHVGGGWAMLVLGILLGAVAAWKIARGGFTNHRGTHFLMALGAMGFFMGGGQVLHEAYAVPGNVLSDPQGGTVNVYSGFQEYTNTSGVPLWIADVDVNDCPDPDPASSADAIKGGTGAEAASGDQQAEVLPAIPQCIADETTLAAGESCFTDFPPCEFDRVTFREGYYWVRADYPAQDDDHAAVCAEFGLVSTARNVTLTWDATLLSNLSQDFGYLSNGVDAESATSMLCWDGDGPHTPAGYCETHNFGPQYTNYGNYYNDDDIRPVFTCTDVD